VCLEHPQQLLDCVLNLASTPLHHQHCNTLSHTALRSLAARLCTTPTDWDGGRRRRRRKEEQQGKGYVFMSLH
jgi:hypothetical protein